jgi:hypothetical protein
MSTIIKIELSEAVSPKVKPLQALPPRPDRHRHTLAQLALICKEPKPRVPIVFSKESKSSILTN